MKLRIIINLLPIAVGGGLQVANEFVRQLSADTNSDIKWLMIKRNSNQNSLSICSNVDIIEVEDNLISRMKFELFSYRTVFEKFEPDAVFTLFGTSLYKTKALKINGIAYSNLFYPEIDFWQREKMLNKILKSIIDKYRLYNLKTADGLIFETYGLKRKANRIKMLKGIELFTVLPSIHNNIYSINKNEIIDSKLRDAKNSYKILFLSGYHTNKNLDRIPQIVKALKNQYNTDDITFILTIEETNKSKKFIEIISDIAYKTNIVNIGMVKHEHIGYLYSRIDSCMLLSNLESFSNNIIESWASRTPLIISDYEWSRSICGESALYVKNDDLDDICIKIIRLKNNVGLQKKLTEEGQKILKEYPTPNEKYQQYIKIIKMLVKRRNDELGKGI
jgi:glycosyltransferase involved in cell wall biosynthesis